MTRNQKMKYPAPPVNDAIAAISTYSSERDLRIAKFRDRQDEKKIRCDKNLSRHGRGAADGSAATTAASASAAASTESRRSKSPPWPGMMPPESFTSKRRLAKD